MSATKMEVLKLYKLLLRESSKFPSYNFREYALERVKAAFRENRNAREPEVVNQLIAKGYQNLKIVERQVIVGNMFQPNKLVIEKP